MIPAFRLNSDGSVDTDFATSGFYTNTTGNIIYALQIQTDGKIVIAGYNDDTDWYIGRLTNNINPSTLIAANYPNSGLI